MTWVPINVEGDHLERLARGEPIAGIVELIWNAVDAEATAISVTVAEDELGAVEEVRVEDDGHGMNHEDAINDFSHLGGSWKHRAELSKNRTRILHGHEGKGRWKAFTLGPQVVWKTVAETNGDRELTTISGFHRRTNGFDIADPESTNKSTGTCVQVRAGQPGPRGLLGDSAPNTLTATFALYLRMYPDLLITYRSVDLDPANLEVHSAEYTLETPNQRYGEVGLTIIEWSDQVDVKRGLFLCDSNGIALADLKASIQAKGYLFTAYIRWAGFREMEDRLLLAETDAEMGPIIDAARDQMREHFKHRRDEDLRSVVTAWKEADVYPFENDPADEQEAITRDLFDVVAVTAAQAVNATEDDVAKRFSLRLLREALENNPTTLRRVLTEVLQLPPDSLEELNRLLDQTTLAKIVRASSMISKRLEFLEALDILVFDRDAKPRIKERSQLHRILADETWVFGEEYALTADDQTLTSALKAHIRCLGRDELSRPEPVLDEEDKERVLDLLLARSVPQTQDRMEHLVVELKAPKVRIGSDQITQIEKYAFAVAGDSRFDMIEVQWDFVVVSSELNEYGKRRASQSLRMPGLIYVSDDGTIRIWAKTWSQIIGAARHRHKFVQNTLRYTPGSAEALSYLREVHGKYLPEGLPTPPTTDDGSEAS